MTSHLFPSFIIAATLVLSACDTPEAVDTRIPPVAFTPHERDSAEHLRDSLTLLADDLIKKHFVLKEEDFSYPTYYHRNWSEMYCLTTDGLTAGLDTNGYLFLVSCVDAHLVELYARKNVKHNNFKLHIGDSTFLTTFSEDYSLMKDFGEQKTEYTLFPQPTSRTMSEVIANHVNDEIKVQVYCDKQDVNQYTLTTGDKEAIRDCLELSRILHERKMLREMLGN